MAFQRLVLVVAVTWLLVAAPAVGRELPPSAGDSGRALQARLAGGLLALGGGGLVECWNALLQLKSCANDIMLFFLDGEARLGADCCGAIQVITRQCWPAMLASSGFTVAEADVLRGYCDAEGTVAAAPAPETDASAPPPASTVA